MGGHGERTASEWLGRRASREGAPILRLFASPARELEDYMSERVQFVITAQEWDPSFEEVSAGRAGRGRPRLSQHIPQPLLADTFLPVPVPLPPPFAGPDGQPLPGVRPPPLDLQLQREAEVTSPPALRGGAPGVKCVRTHMDAYTHARTYVHAYTHTHTSLIKETWLGAAALPSRASENPLRLPAFCLRFGSTRL